MRVQELSSGEPPGGISPGDLIRRIERILQRVSIDTDAQSAAPGAASRGAALPAVREDGSAARR